MVQTWLTMSTLPTIKSRIFRIIMIRERISFVSSSPHADSLLPARYLMQMELWTHVHVADLSSCSGALPCQRGLLVRSIVYCRLLIHWSRLARDFQHLSLVFFL
jgi:hypothetical protein